MRRRISFVVDESDYEILKEYAALRGYAKLSDLARRAVWRFCGQNPLSGRVLGESTKNEVKGNVAGKATDGIGKGQGND